MQPNPLFSLKFSALFPLLFIGLLWLFKVLETLTGLSLTEFGIYPGKLSGIIGIPLAPLIHGSIAHLIANTLPLFVLGTIMIHVYPRSAIHAIPIIYLLSGIGVWLFGRQAYHIGASGLLYGMVAFVFVIGVIRRDRLPVALSMITFFLYGGMVWGIFPGDPSISFEAHFFGALTGVALAIIMKDHDAKIPEKRYGWQDEPDDVEDPIIGDEWRQP